MLICIISWDFLYPKFYLCWHFVDYTLYCFLDHLSINLIFIITNLTMEQYNFDQVSKYIDKVKLNITNRVDKYIIDNDKRLTNHIYLWCW